MSSSLNLPSKFPVALFETVKDRIVAKLRNPSPELDNFLGGYNGVLMRLRACADYSEDFLTSLKRVGTAPHLEDRYQQERQLFGFFVSGFAAMDSFHFLIYFAAAHLQPTHFPTQTTTNIKAITRDLTAKQFNLRFPGAPLTIALNSLANNPDFDKWKNYRNILAHRAAPGRLQFMSTRPKAPAQAPVWKIEPSANISIDEKLTPPRLDWLVATLAGLIVAAEQFANKHF